MQTLAQGSSRKETSVTRCRVQLRDDPSCQVVFQLNFQRICSAHCNKNKPFTETSLQSHLLVLLRPRDYCKHNCISPKLDTYQFSLLIALCALILVLRIWWYINTRADNFPYSRRQFAWKCIDIARRNNVSITLETGSEYVFQNPQIKFHCGTHFQLNRRQTRGKFETR